MTPQVRPIKEQIDKLDFIKLNFCASQDTSKKMKRQAAVWEKIFANRTPALTEFIFFRGHGRGEWGTQKQINK